MPTGYTAAVQDGKITEFLDFAMQCARAFGATITMRDDPSDAPIPEAFEPENYNAERLVEAQEKIASLNAMTDAEKAAAAQKHFEDEADSWDRYETEKAKGVARYQAMLTSVEAWEPPTSEHVGLKDFMMKQLRESIEFDGHSAYRPRPTLKPVNQWFSEAVQHAYHDLGYHAEEFSKEIERVRKSNEWVRALRDSLASNKSESSI